MGRLRTSTLVVEKTDMDDGGVYICRNTEEVHAEVTVRILNGEILEYKLIYIFEKRRQLQLCL